MTLPDPRRTRAVLVGVSDYINLPALPAVRNNVETLRGILTSSHSWNLSSRHCIAIHNPKTPEDLVDPILQCVEEATDTLLVYYAGHGLKGANRGEFRLSRSTSRAGAPHTSTDYNDIREALIESTADRRIVILDCCYAASALGVMAHPADSVAEEAIVEGTYLIAASGETQAAISDDGNGFTVFTGELVRLLRDGVPETAKQFMDLDTVFSQLHASLRAKGRPLPHRRVRNSPGHLTLARNKQWSGWLSDSQSSSGRGLRSLGNDQVLQGVSSGSESVLGGPLDADEMPAKLGSTTPDAEVLRTPAEPGAWSVVQRNPGAWPTAQTSKPSSTPSAAPASQGRPGAWPSADTVVPPVITEAAVAETRSAGGWPKVRQPPQKKAPPRVPPIEELWPQILKEVKERRRFAWILLSQNVRVTGFDGTAMQLEFVSESSKETYKSAGVDAVLEGVIRDSFKAEWKISVTGASDVPATPGGRSDSPSTKVEYGKMARRPGEWPKISEPKRPAGASVTLEEIWPQILEAVKRRRRFAWILLAQYAKATRLDDNELELTFENDATRQNYLSSGCGDVLEQVLREVFGLAWKIDISKLDMSEVPD